MRRPNYLEVRTWLFREAGVLGSPPSRASSRVPRELPPEMFHEEHGEVFVKAEYEDDYAELWEEIEGASSNQRR